MCQDCTWLIFLFIKMHIFDNSPDETFTIRGVINGKVGCKANIICFIPKYFTEDAVESAGPKISGLFFADKFTNTLFHFPCCFIGKCQSHNAPRLISLFNQIGNLVGYNTSLTTTCTCNYKRRTIATENCLSLALV